MKLQTRNRAVIKTLRGLLAGLCLAALVTAHAGDFTVKDLQGSTHRLADYRGKWVLVNFWGTWCSPCLSELPELSSLHDAHQDIVVIGVAMQSGSSAKVADFVAAHRITYPIVMGTYAIADQIGNAAGQTEGLEVLPTSLLFGPNGELVYEQAGKVARKTIEKFMKGKTSN